MTRILGALIAVFLLAMIYLSATVAERQKVLRQIAHHNDTWALSQTVQEFIRLTLALGLSRSSDQEVDLVDVRLRLDIMISRIISLREGTLGKFLDANEDRRRIVSQVVALVEELDRDLETMNTAEVDALLVQMNATVGPLTNLSSQSVQHSWLTVETNLQSLQSLQQIFLAVVTVMVLCWVSLLILYMQRTHLLAISKEDGELLNASLNTASDQLRMQNQNLEYAAYHDPLTSLPNRTLFWSELDKALAELGTRIDAVSLLLIDLDEFKSVNDTLGHDAGDRLLIQVSQRLMDFAHKPQMFCRLGGDEFACLLLGKSKEESIAYGNAIATDISAPYNLLDQRAEIGCSVGIAHVEQGMDVPTQLLFKRADIALYRAKVSEIPRVCAFEHIMQIEFDDRKILEVDLRQAVSTGLIQVFYQAQVDIRSNEVTGMEALARWSHTTRGNIPPSTFIPIAEDLGIISDLGRMILTEACAEAVQWTRPIKISVNLSSIQLRSPDMFDIVQDVLVSTGLDPERLELEITESVLLSNQDNVLTSISRLRAMGVTVAMDDFGTGYSSLAVLRRIPFDIIKVDKAFIRDITTDNEALALLKLVIDIGDLLGKKVVVEGIETTVQQEIIRDLGAVTGQGFLFGRPVPSSDLNELRTV